MAEEIKIKVDLEATEKSIQNLKDQKAFSKKDSMAIETLLQKAKDYPALDKMGSTQLSEFKKVLKDIDTLINRAVAKVAQLSPEYKKQQRKTSIQKKNVDKKRDSYNKIKDIEKWEEDDLQERIAASGYKFRNTNTKRSLTNAGSIAAAYQAGALGIKGADGKAITDTQTYNNIISSLKLQSLVNTRSVIEKIQQELDDAKKQLEESQKLLDEILSKEKLISPENQEALRTSSRNVQATTIEMDSRSEKKE